MSELWELPAESMAAGVRSGELSAVEIAESCLARTAGVEPLIGAYLQRTEQEARERALRIDQRRRAGQPLGRLAGVPLALKDNLSLAGTPLTCGSRILQGYVAPYTATAVERVLEADAVILGKTNLDEFAMGSSCENSALQRTRNPWHLGMVPGGSSGGSAAAVAAGSVPLALGSDTGGSIRQPAALCGIVGLKPSYGRVSRHGLVAFGSSLDQIGPLARSVRDAALALGVIAGGDARDTTCAAEPPADYLEGIEDGCAGWRVGVVREVDLSTMAADGRRAWAQGCERLQRAGAELVEVSIPSLPAAVAVYYVLANSEASANLARFDGVRYGRRGASSDLLGLYLASRSEGFGAEVKRRIMLGTFALSSGYYEAYFGRARGVQESLRRQFEAALGRCDLIATPTSPTGAFAFGEQSEEPLTMYLNDIFTVPANLAGLPAVSVPTGVDDRGLPLALQLLARPFDEARLLRAARAFEALAGWSVTPAFAGAAAADTAPAPENGGH
jgi:aspartyl-tRNA(Asn)/glutamyl-tRNA(Gln) amidotransferase subunit A